MGKIWLQTDSGKLIHLPVVGEDINTPDDPQIIPTSLLSNQVLNRCFDDPITVTSPTHGEITFDFSSPGRTGSCNSCGQ